MEAILERVAEAEATGDAGARTAVEAEAVAEIQAIAEAVAEVEDIAAAELEAIAGAVDEVEVIAEAEAVVLAEADGPTTAIAEAVEPPRLEDPAEAALTPALSDEPAEVEPLAAHGIPAYVEAEILSVSNPNQKTNQTLPPLTARATKRRPPRPRARLTGYHRLADQPAHPFPPVRSTKWQPRQRSSIPSPT